MAFFKAGRQQEAKWELEKALHFEASSDGSAEAKETLSTIARALNQAALTCRCLNPWLLVSVRAQALLQRDVIQEFFQYISRSLSTRRIFCSEGNGSGTLTTA
jgi:hypothetical protein